VRVTRIGPNNDSNGKPFVYDELLPRMRAVLRRAAGPHHPRLEIRDLDIDLASRVVKVSGEPVQLSAKEYELLMRLAETPASDSRPRLLPQAAG
jgi:DNA-binding response OmpR family regulator